MVEKKQASETSRAFAEDGTLKTHVGGQALLEGIMMRGKLNWAVAVREPDGGIYTEEHDLSLGGDPKSKLNWPLVRGVRAFIGSLVLGYRALSIAVEHAFVEEEDDVQKVSCEDKREPLVAEEKGSEFSWKRDFGNPDEMIDGLCAQRTLEIIDGETGRAVTASTFDDSQLTDQFFSDDHLNGDTSKEVTLKEEVSKEDSATNVRNNMCKNESNGSNKNRPGSQDSSNVKEPAPLLNDKALLVSLVFGLVIGIALFVAAPAFLTNLIVGDYDEHTLAWNIVDGLLRICIFIFYIWLIGRMSDIKTMFGYHGAEHKTIHCFEHGLALTPENARSFPRLHVRCGTAFLIMVMVLAIFIYTITPINGLIEALGITASAPKLVLVICTRIVLLPIIAGLAYEITVKWAGTHPNNPLVRIVLWPGMQMQRLTTREPNDKQIECAIAAMQLVLNREQAAELSQ